MQTANVPIQNNLPKYYQTNFALIFGQNRQLIMINWADQTDTMAQQM